MGHTFKMALTMSKDGTAIKDMTSEKTIIVLFNRLGQSYLVYKQEHGRKQAAGLLGIFTGAQALDQIAEIYGEGNWDPGKK